MPKPQTEPVLERPLPQNIEAERSVLGAILLDNHALNTVAEKLRPEDFFSDEHRRIYAQMIQLGATLQAIDLVTLSDQLRRRGEIESAGGVAYLSQLVDGVPRVSNVAQYAGIVREKAQQRAWVYAAEEIRQSALEGLESSDVIRDRVQQALSQIGGPGASSDWRTAFHSFTDFENATALTFAIDGFLQNDGATLIGGLSGHGKTLLLLSVTAALLAGKGTRLWDLFTVNETAERIVYLIPESAIRPFKHRLELFRLLEHVKAERLMVRTLSMGPAPSLSDPRILTAAKGAHVILDTAVRFAEGDENQAGDNQRGLATDIFALLGAGARSVIGAHHSPKPFAKETVMRLESVLRGSGDIGAMVATAWGIKQLDAERNIIHIENVKPRDFQPCGPFQIIGRPHIDQGGDFVIHKKPGECGALVEEQQPSRDEGGASLESRLERARRIDMVRDWLTKDSNRTLADLKTLFLGSGISVSEAAVKKYKRDAMR